MKKFLTIILAMLAMAACKKDNNNNPSGFTNTYTYNGTTTDIKWGGFYYDSTEDIYAISVCKERPANKLIDEDEFISFKVPGALMNTTVNVNDVYDDTLYGPYYFMACFGYHGYLYIRQEGDFLPEGIDSGTFKVTRDGESSYFTVTFNLTLNDGNTVSGNYSGIFQEGAQYSDIGVVIPSNNKEHNISIKG